MALHRLYKRLYKRLYNGSAITCIVTHTIVRTTSSILSIQMALYYLYVVSTNSLLCISVIARFVYLQQLCIVSMTALLVLIQSPYNRLYEWLCIVSTNGCIVSINGSATALQRLYEWLFEWLYERLYNGSTIAHTIVSANGSALSL